MPNQKIEMTIEGFADSLDGTNAVKRGTCAIVGHRTSIVVVCNNIHHELVAKISKYVLLENQIHLSGHTFFSVVGKLTQSNATIDLSVISERKGYTMK